MGSDERAAPSLETIDRDALRSTLTEYPLRLAILFGSTVDGTPTPQSDVDIGVLFEADCSAADRRELYLDLHSTVAAALGTDQVDVTLLDDIPPAVGRQALQSYEVLVGDATLAEELRDRYESAAPPPTHDDLVERLDESLATLDDALDAEDHRPVRHDSG